MAKFKLTPVQIFRLQQARETILAVRAEIDQIKALGDASFSLVFLGSAARNCTEVLDLANPPAQGCAQ